MITAERPKPCERCGGVEGVDEDCIEMETCECCGEWLCWVCWANNHMALMQ